MKQTTNHEGITTMSTNRTDVHRPAELTTENYEYVGGYWEARDRGVWENCRDVFK